MRANSCDCDATMASGAGPRARGTDGADFKFRQRVDNHYKLMADSRARLTTACRLQQGAALAFVAEGCTSYSLALPFLSDPAVCAVEAVTLLLAAMFGLGLAKAKDRPEQHAARYSPTCTLLLVMFVAQARRAAHAHSNTWSPTPRAFAQLGYRAFLAFTGSFSEEANALLAEGTHCVRRRHQPLASTA